MKEEIIRFLINHSRGILEVVLAVAIYLIAFNKGANSAFRDMNHR